MELSEQPRARRTVTGTVDIAACNIILCGGALNYTALPVSTNQSNAMIPINGKPVIGRILDDLLSKGIDCATVVVREHDVRTQTFLRRAYGTRMKLDIVRLREEGTILQSIRAGLSRGPCDGLVRIILGDTLIRDPFDSDEDFVYVGEVSDSRRWCVAFVESNGNIDDYADKQELSGAPYYALAGYYHLTHGGDLRMCVERSVANGEREISDVLRRYAAYHPLKARLVREWFDFGHIDNLVEARRQLLQPRFFNTMTINPVLNTITKVSHYTQKLHDELNWYRDLPEELKVLTPRIISTAEVDGNLHICQEFYGYPTLAELYTFGELGNDIWGSILRRVLGIHREFRRYSSQLDEAHLRSMYLDKTWQRIDALREQDDWWRSLLSQEAVTFNGARLHNIYTMRSRLDARGAEIAATAPISIIHGDFCFSNILFDLPNQIIRVIDPRGSFGRSGIYGDPRYDIAKLRHSVSELYDFIMADMFDFTQHDQGFTSQVYADGRRRVVAAEFDRLIVSAGYQLDEVKFIEGLLFVSMVPLHAGAPQRQKLLYLTGLTLLNEVLPCES